jgi:hypothetical protein
MEHTISKPDLRNAKGPYETESGSAFRLPDGTWVEHDDIEDTWRLFEPDEG